MSENECKVEPDCFLVITASSRIPADTDHACTDWTPAPQLCQHFDSAKI